MVKMGAVSLDGEKITDLEARLPRAEGTLVKVGKRKYLKVTAR